MTAGRASGPVRARAGRGLRTALALACATVLSTPTMAAIPDDGRNFSTLDGITPRNAARLERAWTYRTGDLAHHTADELANSSLQAAPRLIAGSIVFCTAFSEVIALDPATGRERWRFNPRLNESLPQAYQFKCRGPLPTWTDTAAPPDAACRSRIFFATLDQRLLAVDARTGRRCAGFGRNGEVTIIAPGQEKYPNDIRFLTMPIVVGDRLVLGSAMTDNFHVDNPSGKVRAFDVRSGAVAWTFDPIPRGPQDPNMRTWNPATAPANGGANVWTLIASDPANGLVFLPTTSPTVDHFAGQRPGDNLYADSLVALDAETGKMRWFRQIVHHDVWDYDLPAQPIVTDMTVKGRLVHAVIQNTKQGLVFVFDRLTGQPIFPVAERAAPQGGVPGERLSPTQPIPVGMPPLGPVGVRESDLWGLAYFDRLACLRHFRALRHDGFYAPPSLQGTLMRPSFFGGTNWGGASYNAKTGVMIAPVITVASILKLTPKSVPAPPPPHGHVTFQDGPVTFPANGSPYRPTLQLFTSPLGAPCTRPPWFTLVALDVPHRKILWRVPLGTVEEQLPLPIPIAWGTPSTGGLVTTAGGVTLIGATLDRKVRAFDASNGRELWSDRLPTTANSIPFVYRLGKYDYVVFIAGGHTLLKTKPGDWVVAYRVRRS